MFGEEPHLCCHEWRGDRAGCPAVGKLSGDKLRAAKSVAGFTGTQEFDLQTNGASRSESKSVADNANRGRPDSL